MSQFTLFWKAISTFFMSRTNSLLEKKQSNKTVYTNCSLLAAKRDASNISTSTALEYNH